MIDRLILACSSGIEVIPWGAPIPAFGLLRHARIATLGLNPSNLEFTDHCGTELSGRTRRFHTLRSLGLARWSQATGVHERLIWKSCDEYFEGNPYLPWFGQLQGVLGGASYFDGPLRACHLDLVPFATASKWALLPSDHRAALLTLSEDLLALLLKQSRISVLVLNGASVVRWFEQVAWASLDRATAPAWSLNRTRGPLVAGISYRGTVRAIGGVDLGREVLVLGYNLNLQSSFGVTRTARDAIGTWVGRHVKAVAA